ncbi:MAG: DNA-processing protein DprA [Thioalkalispiraceae bacterium]
MPDTSPPLHDWLVLCHAPGVGSTTIQQLLSHFESPRQIIDAGRDALLSAGLSRSSIDGLLEPDEKAIEADLAWAEQQQAHILTLDDDSYPPLLREIADPPAVLFVYGEPEILLQPQLAMVGSRQTSPAGQETAKEFACALASSGLVITSGMALGIDAASHRGALQAGGKTIAVTGTGLDRVYPAHHKQLAHEIAENGALVSEFPIGTPPLAGNFPRRNRLISGLSLGVLVVEAAIKSGSLITARLALEQGREVLAIPGSIHNPHSRGANSLIRNGAKLVETAQDVLEELPGVTWSNDLMVENSPALSTPELDESYQKVLENVGFEPTSVDTIVERSGLTPDAVCSMLLVLELQGFVAASNGGYYSQTC